MNSIPVFKTGGHVVTPFIVTMTAYPGEYFVFVDEDYPDAQRLQNYKRWLQLERDTNRDVQRFSSREVVIFLELHEMGKDIDPRDGSGIPTEAELDYAYRVHGGSKMS